MSYVPSNARWFVAELVLEIQVEGDHRNVVHKNLVLVEAGSAEEAYQKALQLGSDSEMSYENPKAKSVSIRFRGISELDVIGAELSHGTEVRFEQHIAVSEDRIHQWMRPKAQLSVFLPMEPGRGPDYSSKEIMQDVAKLLKGGNDQPE